MALRRSSVRPRDGKMPIDDSAFASFVRYRHTTFRNLVSTDRTKVFRCEMQNLPSRRVICENAEISWEEKAVPALGPLNSFFRSEMVMGLLSVCLGRSIIVKGMHCWTSCYRTGEYIDRHTDGAGDIQLILLIKAAKRENGGWLNLEWSGEKHRVFLDEGDALCFLATEVEHFTDPLVRSSSLPNPERIIAVARYFFD